MLCGYVQGSLSLEGNRLLSRRWFAIWPRRARSFVVFLLGHLIYGVTSAEERALDSFRGLVGEAEDRRLAIVSNDLPRDTALKALLGNTGLFCTPSTGCNTITQLYAGMVINRIQLGIEHLGLTFNESLTTDARLRVVPADMRSYQARAGDCRQNGYNALNDAVVASPWSGRGAETTVSGGVVSSNVGIMFLMGGTYRICYSDDGTFDPDHGDLSTVNLYVKGMLDDSRTCYGSEKNCLSQRRHFCYVLKNGYNNADNLYGGDTSCVVDLNRNGGDVVGFVGKASWTAPYSAAYSPANLVNFGADDFFQTPVKVASVTPQKCMTPPAYFLCTDGGNCDTGNAEMTLTQPRILAKIPVARNDLGAARFKPYQIGVCYCPDYDGCNARTDFLQQVGVLYYFVTKTCAHGDDGLACYSDFTGAATAFRFALKVECPGDACTFAGESRIKIVAKDETNDLPSWDSNNGCFKAKHGISKEKLIANGVIIKGKIVLHPSDNLDVAIQDGGPREDFKLWNFLSDHGNITSTSTTSTSTTTSSTSTSTTEPNITYNTSMTFTTTTMMYEYRPSETNLTAGFLMRMGHNLHERVSFTKEETFDICFCNDECHIQRNWFKTGQFRATPLGLVSAASNATTEAKLFALQHVNMPGILGFKRLFNASNQLGMQEGSMIKLVEDNEMAIDDEGCKTASYNSSVTNTTIGLGPMTAPTMFRGKANPGDPEKILFNGGDLSNRIIVQKAGTIAICYCPVTDGYYCHRNNWVLMSRMTIRGPAPGQSWLFSTHVTFRFSFTGFGLTNEDKVRIIPATSMCSDDENNPNGATVLTGMRMACPDPCVEIGAANQPINGDLSVSTLADDRYECDMLNEQCLHSDIKEVLVLNETHTEIQFTAAPGLQDGDLLTLGHNIICDPYDTTCTPEQLETLKGHYRFADWEDNTPVTRDDYIAGHSVLKTDHPQTFLLNFGWPSPPPKFKVGINQGKRGRWNRHSKAITRQEIVGTKQRNDMKVCWKYPGALGSYVAQVGTITLQEPPAIPNCLISMSSTIKRQPSPMILSFRTSSLDAAPRYGIVEGMTQLKVLLTDVTSLDARYSDGLPIKPDTSADELREAKQFICGSIFKEMWSSEPTLGFPMPKGCHHRAFGIKREISIVFDRKNGLSADTDYQLVLYGITQETAKQNSIYAEFVVMDDTVYKPFESIQRGLASLQNAPQNVASGTKGVMFLEPDGFNVVRGDRGGLYEMTPGKSLFFQFKGEPMGGGISQNSILRIFLWPFTQWNVHQQCSALCHAVDEDLAPCGAIRACTGESVVPGFHRNVLRLVLPTGMTPASDVLHHTLQIDDLKLPPGGIFPLRFPAQISKPDDTRPHYVHAGGDKLFKVPEAGQTYARLVNVYGDGNQKPFRGDSQNVLYAQIVLGATLYSAVQTGDAFLTITMPPGYTCVRLLDLTDYDHEGIPYKVSAWQAEETLGVFGNRIPQGRGTPDEGAGVRGWSVEQNNCTHQLRHNAIVYAYSSLYFRLTMDNPLKTMKREDPLNKWYVTLRGKGYHGEFVDFPPVQFDSPIGRFAPNSAVLGRMDAASIVPWSFTHSIFAKPSELYVFLLTEQHNNVEGFVQVVSPMGFKFDTARNGHCDASDLPAQYYALRNPGHDTSRLPGIVSCTYRTTDFSRAEIKLEGMLLERKWYGFRLGVRNTVLYNAAQQMEWKLYTLTKLGFRVDGTPLPVKLAKTPSSLCPLQNPVTNKSFGVYRFELKDVAVLVSHLRPYTLFGFRSTITIRPMQLPVTANSTLRVIAPAGYLWDFSENEFKNNPTAGEGGFLPCITQAMPGGFPQMASNLLLWSTKAEYLEKEVYGFQALARIPSSSPTSSINAFIIEFGYDANSSVNRSAASTVSPQRDAGGSHVDVAVDHLIFDIYTGYLRPGGALIITGPSPNYFIVDKNCTGNVTNTTPQVGCTEAPRMLPSDSICNSTKSGPQGLVIEIVAGPSGLIGNYRFKLHIREKQVQAKPNFLKLDSPCGLDRCWRLAAVYNAAISPPFVISSYPLQGPLSSLDKLRYPDEVAALSDVSVDYSSNVNGDINNLTFTIRTVTGVPGGGGIEIIGPEGFDIPSTCVLEEPTGVRGSPYYVWSTKNSRKMLPPDATCTSTATPGIGGQVPVPGYVTIYIRAGVLGVLPGLYRFHIKVRNPMLYQTNPLDLSTPCGYRHCWLFKSIENLAVKPYKHLDVPLSTKSYPINRMFLKGHMPELTWPQRGATKRDDRPLQENQLVFAFKLNRAAVYAGYFRLRAPLGYVFREECIPDVVTNSSLVFRGTLPSAYTPWDPDARVTSCRGEGPDLEFYVDPGASPGLDALELFAIRVTVIHNPAFYPIDNSWQFSFAMESALLFEGFPLWTFGRTSLHGISWARSSVYINRPKLHNPVTFTIRPSKDVRGKGMKIKVTAPPLYKFVHVRGECTISIQKLDLGAPGASTVGPSAPLMNFTDISSLLSPSFVRWGESEMDCQVNQTTNRHLTATILVGNRELLEGHDYQLTVLVINPISFPPTPSPWNDPYPWVTDNHYAWTLTYAMWQIQTEAGENEHHPLFRDLSHIEASLVGQRLRGWSVLNQDPFTEEQQLVGKAKVSDVMFTIGLVTLPVRGDYIWIEAPFGFNLTENPPIPNWEDAISPAPTVDDSDDWAPCNNLRWFGNAMDYSAKTAVMCKARRMIINFTDLNITKGSDGFPLTMSFLMDLVNPVKTPHATLNHWLCRHNTFDHFTRVDDAQLSWPIHANLENVMVNLTGKNKAEQATSSLEITFTPVSDAGVLVLEAIQPTKGWSFEGAYAVSLGHEVIYEVRTTEKEFATVRVRCTLFAGLPVIIRLSGLTLGYWGGGTSFDLLTQLPNGERKDAALGFASGFRLPGRIAIVKQNLANSYQQEPQKHPVPALWSTRMSESAEANFTMTFTQIAKNNTRLRIRAIPYEIKMAIFKYGEVESIAFDQIILRINATMPNWEINAYKRYDITLYVHTPAISTPTDAMWSFEILDSNPLPVNTNDALTEGFPLVPPISFTVYSPRSPPVAEIKAYISLEPKGTGATELLLVSPLNYDFPQNCLFQGGLNNEIENCVRAQKIAGRQAARLKCREPGLLAPVEDLIVWIRMPAKAQAEMSWYLQARNIKLNKELGWAEYAKGIEVTPMSQASVIYSGVPIQDNRIAFMFKPTMRIWPGGKLRIGTPLGFTISCGEAFQPASLPAGSTCNATAAVKIGYFEINLPGGRGGALEPGSHSFVVGGTVPEIVYGSNNFSILAFEPPSRGGRIIDGITTIPGLKREGRIDVIGTSISWGTVRASANTRVQIGFELNANLQNTMTIGEILLRVPPTFEHRVLHQNDLAANTAMNMPWAEPRLDIDDPSLVRIRLNTEGLKPQLKEGKYFFQFPVRVPSRMPPQNVWVLTLCGPPLPGIDANKTCDGERDVRALTSFAWGGFGVGETSPSALIGVVASRAGRLSIASGFGKALIIVSCAFCLTIAA